MKNKMPLTKSQTKQDIIKQLQKDYDPGLATQLITGSPFTAKELVENHLFIDIRTSRGLLSLEDIARILKEALAPEEVAAICRDLLIKNQ